MLPDSGGFSAASGTPCSAGSALSFVCGLCEREHADRAVGGLRLLWTGSCAREKAIEAISDCFRLHMDSGDDNEQLPGYYCRMDRKADLYHRTRIILGIA